MCKTSLNLSISCFCSWVLAWMLLVVLMIAFGPAVSLAQQLTGSTSEADMIETIQRLLQQLGS